MIGYAERKKGKKYYKFCIGDLVLMRRVQSRKHFKSKKEKMQSPYEDLIYEIVGFVDTGKVKLKNEAGVDRIVRISDLGLFKSRNGEPRPQLTQHISKEEFQAISLTSSTISSNLSNHSTTLNYRDKEINSLQNNRRFKILHEKRTRIAKQIIDL